AAAVARRRVRTAPGSLPLVQRAQGSVVRGVLTVESAVWPVFAEFLFQRLGSTLPGSCAHDHAVTRRLLDGSGYDVDGTVAYLRENGGACDCEILLNVDGGVRADREDEAR